MHLLKLREIPGLIDIVVFLECGVLIVDLFTWSWLRLNKGLDIFHHGLLIFKNVSYPTSINSYRLECRSILLLVYRLLIVLCKLCRSLIELLLILSLSLVNFLLRVQIMLLTNTALLLKLSCFDVATSHLWLAMMLSTPTYSTLVLVLSGLPERCPGHESSKPLLKAIIVIIIIVVMLADNWKVVLHGSLQFSFKNEVYP